MTIDRVLFLMLHLAAREPETKWSETYYATASAISEVADTESEAADLIAFGWTESRFNPQAIGDHGQSIGLFQVSKSHAPVMLLMLPKSAAKIALKLMRTSRHICKHLPENVRLSWYTTGGPACYATSAARYRQSLAKRLLLNLIER